MLFFIYYIPFFTKVLTSSRNLVFPNLLKFVHPGMVCHETYKDQSGNWLNPSEIEKVNTTCLKKSDKSKVIIGPSESMSKSKKNTIDPEAMINQYGADAIDGLYYLTALQKRYSMVRYRCDIRIILKNLELKPLNFK